MQRVFLSYGCRLDRNKFKSITNGSRNKPEGGFWAAEFKPNQEYKSDWHELCSRIMPYRIRNFGTIFTLKSSAKIAQINSYEDFKYWYSLYNIPGKKQGLDYVKLSKDYDGIYITKKGLDESVKTTNEITLHGWGVEYLKEKGVINASLMNKAVYDFRKDEQDSLSYTGIEKHLGEDVGGYDTVVSESEFKEL